MKQKTSGRFLVAAASLAGFSISHPAAKAGPIPPSSSYVIATTTPSAPPPQDRSPVIGFTAAPMPNVDLNAPLHLGSDDRQASLKPRLFAPKNNYHGDGYVPGSTVQTEQEKRLRPTPGVGLSVPLD